jgi:hypothetical protein
MRLAYTLWSPGDVYRKLERERYRLFHCENPAAKADHLYNFCVTANALRDFYFRHMGICDRAEKEKHYNHWNSVPELLAAKEIANVSKHFSLDKPQRTKGASPTKSVVVDIFRMPDGQYTHRGRTVCDVEITLLDGGTIKTHDFAQSVLDFWFRYLTSHGIPVEQQTIDDLQSVSPTEA